MLCSLSIVIEGRIGYMMTLVDNDVGVPTPFDAIKVYWPAL